MIKSALRHILTGVTVVASTVVLFVWFHSYFSGSGYRWVEIQEQLPQAEFHGTSLTLAGGGFAILREDFVTTDDAVAAFLTEYGISRWRMDGPNYRSWRNPEYPTLNSNDYGVLASLGFQTAAYREQYPGVVRSRRLYSMPMWAIFLLTAAYPVSRYLSAVMRQQQEDRLALGMCPTCGNCVDDCTERCPACDHKVMIAA
jgi:hypothetical protein